MILITPSLAKSIVAFTIMLLQLDYGINSIVATQC